MTEAIAENNRRDFTNGSRMRVLDILCTADTDGSFRIQLTDEMFGFIAGWVCTHIVVENTSAQTDPTANSDFNIYKDPDYTNSLIGTDGANIVDPDVCNVVQLTTHLPLFDRFFLDVTNNIVDSAIFTIGLICQPASV